MRRFSTHRTAASNAARRPLGRSSRSRGAHLLSPSSPTAAVQRAAQAPLSYMVTAACCMRDASHCGLLRLQPAARHAPHVRGGDSQRRLAQQRWIGMPGQCHAMPSWEWPAAHCDGMQYSEYCKRPQRRSVPSARVLVRLFVCSLVCLFVGSAGCPVLADSVVALAAPSGSAFGSSERSSRQT